MGAGDSIEPWLIIGAGMGGKGIAAELGLQGKALRIHDVDESKIAPIQAAGGLYLEGRQTGFVPLALATTDLSKAVAGAPVILVSIYGTDHGTLATQLAPHLVDGQIIVLIQGHFAGSLHFREALVRAGCRAAVDVAEMDSYPYMLAIAAPDRVTLGSTKKTWRLATMPASRTSAVMAKIGASFPGLEPAETLLHTAFVDIGGISHVGGVITNVGRVESGESYRFYNDNMVPSVCNVLEALDRERVAVAAAYGIVVQNFKSWLSETYNMKVESLYEALQELGTTHYRFAPAPKSLEHRYLVQDLGCATVPLVQLGRVAGVETPVSSAAIQISNALLNRDFNLVGRNLESLNLHGKTVAEIVEYVQ